jgi:hypothetical protein
VSRMTNRVVMVFLLQSVCAAPRAAPGLVPACPKPVRHATIALADRLADLPERDAPAQPAQPSWASANRSPVREPRARSAVRMRIKPGPGTRLSETVSRTRRRVLEMMSPGVSGPDLLRFLSRRGFQGRGAARISLVLTIEQRRHGKDADGEMIRSGPAHARPNEPEARRNPRDSEVATQRRNPSGTSAPRAGGAW